MIPTLELYAGVKDVCWRLQEEMVNTLLLAVSVCLSRLTFPLLCDRQTVQKAPSIPLSNCLFSASAIVTKALCKKGHPEFCVLLFYDYHYFIFFLSVCSSFVVLFICFHSANDYLNATKQYDENGKKKREKLEYLVSGVKAVGTATSSGHKQTHLCFTSTIPVICNLLHSHAKVGEGR